jgi:hypothetical protein
MYCKRLTALAFTSHIVLGSFCMMTMVHAEEMPMEDAMDHASMEMATPISEHCEHCPKAESPDVAEQEESPCDNGHCFSNAAPVVSSVNSTPVPSINASLPNVTVFDAPLEYPVRPRSTAPPPIGIQTIVLRF